MVEVILEHTQMEEGSVAIKLFFLFLVFVFFFFSTWRLTWQKEEGILGIKK